MSLVEWTRLGGDQAEAVIALMVNREHPNSTRITPSKGDGGVDILDRGDGPDGGDVVYQVKSYTGPLNARQKEKVKDSAERLMSDPRWSELRVTRWVLVLPWDPTPEAESWLQDLAKSAGLPTPAVWQGLTHVDQLAAKYDDVIDYFLHGGASRTATAYEQVAALMGMDRMPAQVEDDLSVTAVAERVQGAIGVLDHDPYYRYELGLGEGQPPPPPSESDRPGIVMYVIRGRGERWISVCVIARCRASTSQRPITIRGTLKPDIDDETANQWSDFITYGAPVDLPAGAFTGELDAPGGLGGPMVDTALRITPSAGMDLGDAPQLTLEILDEDDSNLVSADVDRVEVTQGLDATGVRAVLQHTEQCFTVESRGNLTSHQHTMKVSIGDLTGKPVSVAVSALRFLTQMRHPHSMRLRPRHAAAGSGVVVPLDGLNWSEELSLALNNTHRIIDMLQTIQNHAADVILVPKLNAIPREQLLGWRRTQRILDGDEVRGTYPDGHCLTILTDVLIEPAEGTLAISMPHSVTVGDQEVALGRHYVLLDSPTVLDAEPSDGGYIHRFTTPEQTIRWRLAAPSDD